MAEAIDEAYWACLEALGNSDHSPDISYNILLTQKFILIVNRSKEAVKEPGVATVGVNCLGFGGTLAVKRQSDLDYLKKMTPLKILTLVSMEN